MKNYLAIVLLLSLSVACHAQLPLSAMACNDTTLQNVTYCMVTPVKANFSNQINLTIDYGQIDKKVFTWTYLVDESDKRVLFNSPMEALNILYQMGWDVKEVISVKDGEDISLKYFLQRACE